MRTTVGAKTPSGVSLVRALCLSVFSAFAALSCSSADDEPAPACPVCAHSRFTCSSPNNVESVDFRVESQNSTGCDGHLIMAHGPSGALSLKCSPPQVCGANPCVSASFTDDSFKWDGVTCAAYE